MNNVNYNLLDNICGFKYHLPIYGYLDICVSKSMTIYSMYYTWYNTV